MTFEELSKEQVCTLIEWVQKNPRQAPSQAFTAGPLRQTAELMELAAEITWQRVREAIEKWEIQDTMLEMGSGKVLKQGLMKELGS